MKYWEGYPVGGCRSGSVRLKLRRNIARPKLNSSPAPPFHVPHAKSTIFNKNSHRHTGHAVSSDAVQLPKVPVLVPEYV